MSANTPWPDGPAIDGLDLTESVTADAPSARDEFLYYTAQGELAGIRKGDWKLLVRCPAPGKNSGAAPQPALLFNLARDLAETTNLAGRQPDKVAELRALLERRDAAITAGARPVWQATGPTRGPRHQSQNPPRRQTGPPEAPLLPEVT